MIERPKIKIPPWQVRYAEVYNIRFCKTEAEAKRFARTKEFARVERS